MFYSKLLQYIIAYTLEENYVSLQILHKKVTQNILVLKIVEQMWPGMFSYELNKLFLDISQSG